MTEEATRTPRMEKLTSSIREMASRVNAEFVPDNRKSQTYGRAASDQQMMAAANGSDGQKK